MSATRSRPSWPSVGFADWLAVARAELDGGEPEALATPIEPGVEMQPLYLPATRKATGTLVEPPPGSLRLATHCPELPVAGELRPADGYTAVRVTDARVVERLAGGETAVLGPLDPAVAVLGLPAAPAGARAIATLERAGRRHAVVLDVAAAVQPWSPARELAVTFAQAIELLRGSGLRAAPRPEAVAARLHLPLEIGTDLLIQLAKQRAARWLWQTVACAFGLPAELQRLRLWGRASTRCWSGIDPELNLGRAALQVFAATTGGCDVFEPLLFDPRGGMPESLRLAANQHRLLVHEAMLGRVSDPAAGAFALEDLAAQIAERAWGLVQAIEAAGGAGRTGGGIDALPADEAATAPVLVGTHRFADPRARLAAAPDTSDERPAARYEALRRRTRGAAIDAVVLPFGDARLARTPTTWAIELLRTAGIEPRQAPPCASAADLREHLAKAGASVVVLCGLDDATGTFVRAAIGAADGLAQRPLLYATGEPPAGSAGWGRVGFLHRGLDAADTLHGILDRLGVPGV